LCAEPGQIGFAFLVLLDDDGDSLALSQLLTRLLFPASPIPAVVLVPPVRGLDFFADSARQAELDAWWSAEVPGSAQPVYLMMDVAGLEGWLEGVDGTFYIGLRDAARVAVYPAGGRARAFLASGPLDLAVAVMQDHSRARATDAAVFDQVDALRVAALGGRLPLRCGDDPLDAGSEAGRYPVRSPETPREAPVLLPKVAARPAVAITALTSAHAAPAPSDHGAGALDRAAPPAGSARRLSSGGLAGVLRSRARFRPRADAELAHQLAGRGATIVVVGSRKGGVGKTSFAAGIAIVAGTVLDQIGHMACLVDANIANPDAWGQMDLPPGAATVRDTVAALLSNRDTPSPIHATTPALACYPEAREAIEYSRTAIRRLADHLRRRYTVVVIDMSNRLPDPTAGPDAAVAAFWLEVADILVLPTTSARADFNGALDYLEVGGLPPTVVAYIVPGPRRLRENPTTLEYLRAIRRRAISVVEIPDDANAVRLAGMEGVPVERISPPLRLAYRELTETIAVLPRRPQA
jgi:MinD-like ATPase involved in chromosome partitioning or flagellar assembly